MKNENKLGIKGIVMRAMREHRQATVNFIAFNLLLLLLLALFPLYRFFMWEGAGKSIGGCLMIKIFKLYCPVCGGTRALNAILHLDFISALKYSPLCVFLAASVAYFDVRAFVAIVRNEKRILRIGKSFAVAFAVIVILTFVLRNFLLVFYGADPLGDLADFWSVHRIVQP